MFRLFRRIRITNRAKVLFAGFALASATGIYLNVRDDLAILAKPKDTPSYLMPYFLRSARSRFNHYASSAESGEKFMTVDDFLRSLLITDKNHPIKSSDSVQTLFQEVDANHDGKLSFEEYSLFMTCLTARRRDFEMMFKMFDFDNSGSVNYDEFREVIRALQTDRTIRIPSSGGLIDVLFGPDKKKSMTYAEFIKFIEDIRTEVANVEFRQFDPENTGFISSEDFSKLITSAMLGSHLPFYIVKNIRKMQKQKHEKGISSETWRLFNYLMSISYDLEKAIQLYCNCGYPLTRNDFARAVNAVSGINLTTEAVDMVFAIFDRDGNGNLEYDEFLTLLRSKRSFNASERLLNEGTQRNLVQGLFKCAQDAFAARNQ